MVRASSTVLPRTMYSAMSTLRVDSGVAAGAAAGGVAVAAAGVAGGLVGADAWAKAAPWAPIAITASHTALQQFGGAFFFMSCIYSSFSKMKLAWQRLMLESLHVAAAYRYLDARRARRLSFVTKTSSRNWHSVWRGGFFCA